MRQAAAKTNDLAGDGTTTSVVLAQGLIAEGVKVRIKPLHFLNVYSMANVFSVDQLFLFFFSFFKIYSGSCRGCQPCPDNAWY